MTDTTLASNRPRPGDRRAFSVLYALTFTMALPVVVVARLFPQRLFGAHEARPSVIAEARTAASTAIGYAFMG